MKLAVVSDTHGHVAYTRQAVELLERAGVDVVIHCGDVGSAAIVPLFDRWPTHFVQGNVDWPPRLLWDAAEAAGQTCHGEFGSLELEGRRIAFLHGDDRQRLDETIASGAWDLVCHGHTHVAHQVLRGRTLVLNPGALYRATPHTLAIVALPELEVTSHVVT